MANPQPDKHTRLANELLDVIPFYKFNGTQLRIVMVIWRNTYGWMRKDHDFSLSFIHERTLLSESAVKKEVAGLIKARVLLVTKEATKTSARRLAFNKNYEEWTIPRGGDPMDDLFDYEGHDCTPHGDGDEVHNCTPLEVHDCTPQVATMRVTIVPPNKERSLKKSFKENTEYSFDNFYTIYPRKISKQAALKAWNKLSKESSFNPEMIIRNTANYAQTCEMLNTEKNYIPHPSTFLNQKRFEDYDVVDPEGLFKESLLTSALSKFDQDKLRLQQMYEEEARREEDRDRETVRSHPLQLSEFRDD